MRMRDLKIHNHINSLMVLALLFSMAGALSAEPSDRVSSRPQNAVRLPALSPADQSRQIREHVPAFAEERVLVKFRPGTAASDMGKAHRAAGGRKLEEIPGIGVHVVMVPKGSVTARVARYERNPNVLYAEPDYYRLLIIPDEGNDPGSPAGVVAGREFFDEQWGMHNTGQEHTSAASGFPVQVNTAQPDADIDAPEGWEISTGDPSVKIAILDSGMDCQSIEHAGKCIEEASFVESYSSTLEDIAQHGTHVGGIASVNTNNGIGVAGVGWNSSLGNLKTCFEYAYDIAPPLGIYVTVGVCPVSSSAQAITHAADNGYHVINMSYGSDLVDAAGDPSGIPVQPNTETAAIEYAWSKGVVMVAAAGNDGTTTRIYPAANDNVIAVGATSDADNLASFSTGGSNYSVPGDHWVSLMAPGKDILSTVPVDACRFSAELLGYDFDETTEGCVTWSSGTSMASPHVAGAAALVWHHLFPGQSPDGCTSPSGVTCNVVVRKHLEYGADGMGATTQNMLAWSEYGRLNVHGALAIADADLDGFPNSIDNDDDNDGIDDAADTDDDNDGLADIVESALGTDPLDSDTDDDGLTDGYEVSFNDTPPDTYTAGSDPDPLHPDTDGDGIRDGDEVMVSLTDPLDATSTPADGDVNLDGEVNVADLLMAQRALLIGPELGWEQQLHADVAPLVDGVPVPDGDFGLGDILVIQRMVVEGL